MTSTATPEKVSERIAQAIAHTTEVAKRDLERGETVEDAVAFAAALFEDRLKSLTVAELTGFLAAEGVRFTGKPKRAEVVESILEFFAPTAEFVTAAKAEIVW